MTGEPKWLRWAKQIQAIAQTGLAYVRDPYDRERYEQLRELSVEMMSDACGEAPEDVRRLFAGETGYATPKVDVRGVVFRDGRILLVRERMDGLWTLPGGWADIGESPAECVVKEVREESGFETRAVELLGVLDRSRHPHPPAPYHIYKLFFLCEIVGGEAKPSLETTEVGFFEHTGLPELSVSRVTPGQIDWLFRRKNTPGAPAEFD